MLLNQTVRTFSMVLTELKAAVSAGRPKSALMRAKWLDGEFAGDTEALLRLFRRESAEALERGTAAYYLAVYEKERRVIKRHLKQIPVEALCRA